MTREIWRIIASILAVISYVIAGRRIRKEWNHPAADPRPLLVDCAVAVFFTLNAIWP